MPTLRGARQLLQRHVMNTWPNGYRHTMSQSDHEAWNANHYPGTLQLCVECEEPTGRCEDDSLYADDDGDIGPLCEKCWQRHADNQGIAGLPRE